LKTVLRPFIPNIHEAYAAADLVVARAGAMTCGEITARGLPAVLVPYPHAKGHQEANARALEKAGSALVILEKELSDENLCQAVLELLKDPQRLKKMGQSAKQLAKPEAAKEIADGLLEMAK
jgi:UDP-N-acetylglucosamine--N-acetylmuramyl-(pentapeptide) pyrophosphoryl-undecaprenol N-acetylglucosamine transferase